MTWLLKNHMQSGWGNTWFNCPAVNHFNSEQRQHLNISHGTDSILKFRDLLLSPCRKGFHCSGVKAGGHEGIPHAFLNAFPYLLPTLSMLFLESSEGRIKTLWRTKNRAFRAKHAVCAKSLQLCPILCNLMDCQAPLSTGFSRQEC